MNPAAKYEKLGVYLCASNNSNSFKEFTTGKYNYTHFLIPGFCFVF